MIFLNSFNFCLVTQHIFNDKFYLLRSKTMPFNTLKDTHNDSKAKVCIVTPKRQTANQPAKQGVSLINTFIQKTLPVTQGAEIKMACAPGKKNSSNLPWTKSSDNAKGKVTFRSFHLFLPTRLIDAASVTDEIKFLKKGPTLEQTEFTKVKNATDVKRLGDSTFPITPQTMCGLGSHT